MMNKFLNVVLKESLTSSPFASNQKCDAAGAAILGDIFGFFGDALGAISQQEANTTNLKIARMNRDLQKETNAQNLALQRETNSQNYKIFQEQNAFNFDMWNKQNAYNSPKEQVARMLAAGINPAAQFGKVSEASALQSASANPMQAAQMVAPQLNYRQQGIDYGFKGIGNAYLQALALKQSMALSDSQINYTNAQAEYQWQSMYAKLLDDWNRAAKGSVEKEQAAEQLRLFKETYDNQKKAIENNAFMTGQEIQKNDLEITAQKIQNNILQIDEKWRENMNLAQWQSIKIGIKEATSRIANNDADSALKAAQQAVEDAKKKGLDISNEQSDRLVNIIVDSAREDLYNKQDERYNRPFQLNYQYQGKAGQWLPEPSGKFAAEELHKRNIRRDRLKGR